VEKFQTFFSKTHLNIGFIFLQLNTYSTEEKRIEYVKKFIKLICIGLCCPMYKNRTCTGPRDYQFNDELGVATINVKNSNEVQNVVKNNAKCNPAIN